MNKIIQWVFNVIAVVALVVTLGSQVGGNNQPVNLGSAGTRFPNGVSADSTSPAIGQLRGTTLVTTGRVGVGTTTPSVSGDLLVDGSGTTTLSITSSSATKGACFQMDDNFGSTTAVTIKNGAFFLAANTQCK